MRTKYLISANMLNDASEQDFQNVQDEMKNISGKLGIDVVVATSRLSFANGSIRHAIAEFESASDLLSVFQRMFANTYGVDLFHVFTRKED